MYAFVHQYRWKDGEYFDLAVVTASNKYIKLQL